MKERRDLSLPASPMADSVTENGQPCFTKSWQTMCSEPEKVPGLDLQETLSVPALLAKVTKLLEGQVPLLERQFSAVQPKDGTVENGADEGNSLRIMQWNILADALSTGKDNFVRCPPAALEWSTRRLYLLLEVLTVNPDILTLQEVDHYGFFKHVLATCGYTGVFFPKPDSPTLYIKNNHGPDGCAVFYRQDKLELIKEDMIILKTKPGDSNTNQVSIIMHFRVRDSGKEATIATTHLKAKNGWETLRLLQGTYLASYLEQEVADQPFVLCGDFNADYNEPVYSVFSDSKLGLSSAYREAGGTGMEPAFTTWKIRGSADGKTEKESKRSIDYVWYTQDKLSLRAVLQLPTAEQIGENRLPSHSYPSDHLSLAADFILN